MKGCVLRNWLMKLWRMNEKSYGLLSAVWGPRRTGGVTESELEGLKARSSESRRRSLSQLKRSGQKPEAPPCSDFLLFPGPSQTG